MSSIKRALGKIVPSRNGVNSSASSIHKDGTEIHSSISSPAATFNDSNTATSPTDPYPKKSKTLPVAESPRASGIFSRVRRGSITANHNNHSHSPIRAVKEKLGLASGESSDDTDQPLNAKGELLSKNQLRKHEKQVIKEKKAEEIEQQRKAVEQKKQDMEERAEIEETESQHARHGVLPFNNYAGNAKHVDRVILTDINASMVGKEITFRARIHAMRRMSAHFVFLLLRQGTQTVQGVLEEHGEITKFFLYWAERLDVESVVLVKGTIQTPKAKQGRVTGASIHDWELLITELHVEGQVSEHLPYTVYEGEVGVKEGGTEEEGKGAISQRVRLANRVIDLRTGTSLAIFRIQSAIGGFFRQYLDSQGFIEIHTPKLQGGATESGASVFKVDYFGRPAFLAQSPQLAKQMAISADFGRVYEIGAVFRAENSNTHRHLTEYTGLDIEMAIDEHYHEVLKVLDNTFKTIFKGIYTKYRHEIEVVKRQFPHEDLVWLDETPVIPFAEAVRLLNDSGWTDEHGNKLPEDEDLGTRDEIQLGRVIKEKYKTDYYVIDKFPVSARPFYAMPDPFDPTVTNGFDIFLRGQEILSGGQRIHDAQFLLKRLEENKIERASMEEYIQGFEFGAPPHGGGGIGLERMTMLLLNLGDIRNASLFHRDPKSFPPRPIVAQLRHPEASTLHPPWSGKDRVLADTDYQPLEKLIANYGDASNTSWLEPRTKLWRDHWTGAAVGYVPQDGFAIIVGNPLCHISQYTKTIAGFLRFLKKETDYRPLWLLVGRDAEEVLAERFNWRTFSVAAEQRVNPSNNQAVHDSEIQRKIRHAEKEGIKAVDIPNGKEVPKEIQDKIDQRVKDWLANRKGKQVHLTNVRLWQDMEHRSYHYATDKSGEIVGLVVLAMLSADYGWQVKWSLDFPNSPSGAIEYLVIHTLKNLANAGITNCTFGAGAAQHFTTGHHMKGAKVKVLSKAYSTIVNELKLTNKSEFREKLGAQDDPVFICYPAHGMGPMAVKAILGFFEGE